MESCIPSNTDWYETGKIVIENFPLTQGDYNIALKN